MADELRKNETNEQDEEKYKELPEELSGSLTSSSEEDEEKHKELSEELSGSLTSSSEEAESKHEFSSPWRNSDLVLIIEDQKIHVHRLILEMISPVLCHIFKETDSNEVPLMRTKVNDFVDLLRVIYPQFKNKITLDNIQHIYKLAEEYQMESVVEILVHAKKTTTNAMKILVTAQVCAADEARKQCYEVLKGLTVAELKNDEYFEDVDENSLRNVILPKAERLEKCLREIQPQLVGLMDCVLYLWLHSENEQKMGGTPNTCPVHQQNIKASKSMQTRMKCSACKEMILQMARRSVSVSRYGGKTTKTHYYSNAGA